MSSEAIAETDRAVGVNPGVPWRIKAFTVLPDWRLAVTFNDGRCGEVDLSELVRSAAAGVFAPLRDPKVFGAVCLEHGALCWPNGADLAPDGLYEEIGRDGICRISD